MNWWIPFLEQYHSVRQSQRWSYQKVPLMLSNINRSKINKWRTSDNHLAVAKHNQTQTFRGIVGHRKTVITSCTIKYERMMIVSVWLIIYFLFYDWRGEIPFSASFRLSKAFPLQNFGRRFPTLAKPSQRYAEQSPKSTIFLLVSNESHQESLPREMNTNWLYVSVGTQVSCCHQMPKRSWYEPITTNLWQYLWLNQPLQWFNQ